MLVESEACANIAVVCLQGQMQVEDSNMIQEGVPNSAPRYGFYSEDDCVFYECENEEEFRQFQVMKPIMQLKMS